MKDTLLVTSGGVFLYPGGGKALGKKECHRSMGTPLDDKERDQDLMEKRKKKDLTECHLLT